MSKEEFEKVLSIVKVNDIKDRPIEYKYQFSNANDSKGTLQIKVIASIALLDGKEVENVVIFDDILSNFGKDIDNDGSPDLGNSLYKISVKEEAKKILPSNLSTISSNSNFIQNYLNIDINNPFKNASFIFNFGNINDGEGTLILQIIVDKTFIDGNVFTNIEIFNQKISGFGKDVDGDKKVDQGTTKITSFELNTNEMKNTIVNSISTIPRNNFIGNFINPKVENNFNGSNLSYEITKKDVKKGIIWVKIRLDKAFVDGLLQNNYQLIGPEQSGLYKFEGFALDVDENNVIDQGTTKYTITINELVSSSILPSQINVNNLSTFLLLSGENIFNNSKIIYSILEANDLKGTIKLKITIDKSFENGIVILNREEIIDLKGFGKDTDLDGTIDTGDTFFKIEWNKDETEKILPSQINFEDENDINYYTNFLTIESFNGFKDSQYKFITSFLDSEGSLEIVIWASSIFKDGIEIKDSKIYSDTVKIFGKLPINLTPIIVWSTIGGMLGLILLILLPIIIIRYRRLKQYDENNELLIGSYNEDINYLESQQNQINLELKNDLEFVEPDENKINEFNYTNDKINDYIEYDDEEHN
ncbi:MAG: lipoprotein 17-related variable surface protein [Metamycoplasmataceae bacterium]